MIALPTTMFTPLGSRAIGLQAYLRLDQASGNMIDGSRFGRTWTNLGSPTRSVAGKWGSCSQYDGVNDIDKCEAADLLSTFSGASALTISCWASATALADLDCAFSIGDDNTNNMIGLYPYWDEAGVARFRVWYNATYIINAASGVLANGTLNHFCYRQTSATSHEGFVNGVSIDTDATSKTIPASIDMAAIGGYGDGEDFYTGKIDHVKLWNRALTTEEIVQDSKHG
jgi:hypothetical protein